MATGITKYEGLIKLLRTLLNCRQLVLISELYSAQQISEYLLPMAMALAEDKVSEVRVNAHHLVSIS